VLSSLKYPGAGELQQSTAIATSQYTHTHTQHSFHDTHSKTASIPGQPGWAGARMSKHTAARDDETGSGHKWNS